MKELQRLIKTLEKYRIPYQRMTSWDRQRSEGFNEGIDFAIFKIEEKIKRLKKKLIDYVEYVGIR